MAKRNKIRDIHEIQVDCDWTESTQVSFFKLCEVLRDMLHKDGIKLSATIRLHQLKKECPPVDCGVLMLYNTGSLYNPDGNSILNYKDVEPYLKTELEYALPLDFAFPVYSWGIWMRKGEFKSILTRQILQIHCIIEKPINGNILFRESTMWKVISLRKVT